MLRVDDVDLVRDRALVEAHQGGDPAAFEALYRLHFARLQRFCARRVGDPSDAEEIAQEAFARAYQGLGGLSGDRRFYPWLTVIAGRLCVDHHRRRGRVTPSDQVDAGVTDDDVAGRLCHEVDVAALERALARIGPRHAEVLDLREWQGLTYHEIAATLGVPHSTVETLLFRARKALRREFLAAGAGRLAGLAPLSWLGHRLQRARARFGDLAEVVTGPLSGPVAAGVLSVALAIAPGGTGARPAPTPAHRSPVPALAVGAPTTSPRSATAADDVDPSPPGSRAHLARLGVETMSDREAAGEAEEMPILVGAGPVVIGTDPARLPDSLARLTTPQEDR